MKMVQSGSTVIVVIIIMTVLMLCTINGLKNRCLLQELLYKQQVYEQQFWAAEGLLQYGIALAQQQQSIPAKQQSTHLALPSSNNYQGVVSLTPMEDCITVRAQLKNQQDKLLCAHSCCISAVQKGDKQQVIHEWKIEV
jgi:hypothetical protein